MCHAGLKASARVAQQKYERSEDIAWLEAALSRDRVIDQRIATQDARVRKTIAAQLNQCGYQYLRGQWRKKQRSKMSEQQNIADLKNEILSKSQVDTIAPEESEELSDDIRRIAIESLRELRQGPKENRANFDGETSNNDDRQVTVFCTIDGTIAEIKEKVRKMRADFQYRHVNSFDRLLIDQLTTAWVHWYVAGWLMDGELSINRTWRQNEYYAKRYQQCQTRLTKCLDQLARIRQIPATKLHIVTQAEKDAAIEAERLRREKRDAEWEANSAAYDAAFDAELAALERDLEAEHSAMAVDED